MILPYYTQKQILTKWCWAAVASSIARFYQTDSEWIQNQVATVLLNVDCSEVTPPNQPTACNQLAELEDALKTTGNYRDKLESYPELADIINEIDHGCPVGCQITWEGVDRSHFVCIFGYDDTTIELSIGDPESRVYIISYENLTAGYRGGQWTRTFYTQTT